MLHVILHRRPGRCVHHTRPTCDVATQVTRRAAKITFVSFLLHRFDATKPTMRRPPASIGELVMPTLRSWPMVQFAICNFFALHALLFLCLQNVPLLARAFLSQRISLRPPTDSPAMLACANPPRLDAFEGVEEKHAKGCLPLSPSPVEGKDLSCP